MPESFSMVFVITRKKIYISRLLQLSSLSETTSSVILCFFHCPSFPCSRSCASFTAPVSLALVPRIPFHKHLLKKGNHARHHPTSPPSLNTLLPKFLNLLTLLQLHHSLSFLSFSSYAKPQSYSIFLSYQA
jgi:hypothetical protein